MKYALYLPNFDLFGEAAMMADLASLAESSGWDGFFIWDHLEWPGSEPAVDPWVALAAVAMATERMRLGTLVTPLPRRDIVKLARETVSVDRLSGGRLVLGVGLGWETIPEWDAFGHEPNKRVRGEMLDEALEVLAALWSGEAVDHAGTHYRVATGGQAQPVQQPRIPIWVGGGWPARRPFRRAAKWDGVMPISPRVMEGEDLSPSDYEEIQSFIQAERAGEQPFDVLKGGMTTGPTDRDAPEAYRAAGATWWLESLIPWGTALDAVRARIQAGPPR